MNHKNLIEQKARKRDSKTYTIVHEMLPLGRLCHVGGGGQEARVECHSNINRLLDVLVENNSSVFFFTYENTLDVCLWLTSDK